LLDESTDQIDLYPGLAAWWREAVAVWNTHRSSGRLTLLERLNFRRGLSQQFPASPHRVVYSKAGMYMAAARIHDPSAVIADTLYWASTSSADEALYLVAILNSDTLTQLVRPLQARGEHNPRHFDKYVFKVPIPMFDRADARHQELAQLALRAERVAVQVALPNRGAFQALRRRIRQGLKADGVGAEIEKVVAELFQRD
jgi:hypothetical protein